MPKVLLAYHRMSAKRNNIKPDNVSSQNHVSLLNEKLEIGHTVGVSSARTDPADDEKYCVCELPYSDGELMFKCEGFCINWYHPRCIGLQASEIEK